MLLLCLIWKSKLFCPKSTTLWLNLLEYLNFKILPISLSFFIINFMFINSIILRSCLRIVINNNILHDRYIKQLNHRGESYERLVNWKNSVDLQKRTKRCTFNSNKLRMDLRLRKRLAIAKRRFPVPHLL